MKLQTFKGCWDKQVDLTTSPETWVEEIRNGYNYSSLIEEARSDYKLNGKVKDGIYDKIKKRKLPVIAWNCLYHTYKIGGNEIGMTGYMYFDVDNAPGFDINQLDKSKIFCFFKSLSETGYGIVIKVSGITLENFKVKYQDIANQIGLSSFYDKNACSIDRNNVLSFDPNIYHNPSSTVLTSDKEPELKKVSSSNYTIEREKREGVLLLNDTFLDKPGKFAIRLNDASDYVTNGEEYQVFKEKIKITNLYFPKPKSITTGRNSWLSTVFGAMLSINPGVPQSNAFKWLSGLNQTFCSSPISSAELIKVFNSNWKMQGVYTVIKKKERRVIFDVNCKKTKEEKQSISRKETAKVQREDRQQQIYNFIEQYVGDNKITSKFVAQELKIGIATVKRYWPGLIKDYVNELNKQKNESRTTKKPQTMERNPELSTGVRTSLQPVQPFTRRNFINREENRQESKANSQAQGTQELLSCESKMDMVCLSAEVHLHL